MIIGAEEVTSSRISTRLSSCNSQEFIIGKGRREERERTVPSRPPNIEFQCGGSPTNLSVGVIDVGRVGQGLIHVVRQSAGLVKQYSGAYGSIADRRRSSSGESLQFINIET